MTEGSGRVASAVGALIALVLQVVLAPYISLNSAVPNFILAYVIVVAIVRAQSCGVVAPFVLGMLYDLIGGGPIGAYALLFALVTFLLSRAFSVLDNDTLFMPLALIIGSTLVVEMLYGVLLLACGVDVSPLEAFVYRSLPCALYDSVIGLIVYPIAVRTIARRAAQQPGTPLIG